MQEAAACAEIVGLSAIEYCTHSNTPPVLQKSLISTPDYSGGRLGIPAREMRETVKGAPE